jgi:protein TonB
MFAETLLESGVARRPGRGWATTASFSLQIAVVGVLVVLPSLYPEIMSLHRATPVSVPIFSEPLPEVAPRPLGQSSGTDTARSIEVINVRDAELTYGPPKHETDVEPATPMPLGIGGRSDLPFNTLNPHIVVPIKPEPPTRPLRVSTISEGNLIRRVQPTYPSPARAAGIQGQVTLTAIISKTGEIESLRVISGHPFLVRAAQDAVHQWRYRPYILNGEPIEVETQITVNFKLSN